MKNTKTTQLLTILILSLITFSACKKDEAPDAEANEPSPVPANTTNDYYPITVGSYWVYEFDFHTPGGTINDNNVIDTLKVIGDTLIDGEIYFVFNTNRPTQNTNYFRRVNQGEIVSETGILICPPDNSYTGVYNSHYDISGTDTTRHTWEEFSGYELVNTTFGPAYGSIQKTIHHKTWPPLGDNTFADTIYYSPIGILQRSYSYFTGAKQVGTLVDYHLE